MPTVHQGMLTFLFTDIVDSSRLWHAYPDRMPVAYVRHDAIIREAVTSHDGVLYKTIGDAFQAVFPTAGDALLAALACQRALSREVWEIPEPLRVRMALQSGDIQPDQHGDYRSPLLNLPGRLLRAGHGSQVLLTAATAELLQGQLPLDVSLIDLGEPRLIGPERVYQVRAEGLPESFPPLRVEMRRRANLPAEPSSFIGRRDDVVAVQTLLQNGDARLVTLTGTGGIGKTRLSLQVARGMVDWFDHKVSFVDVSAAIEPTQAQAVICQVLDIPEPSGMSLEEAILARLRDQHALLVLDNLEQVIGIAPFIARMLEECQQVQVLATSRIRLDLRSEHVVDVHPLALLTSPEELSIAEIAACESVRLFVDRARAFGKGFALTEEDGPAVARICARVDGLPLAIELAAAYTRVLPPAAILDRLGDRLRMLVGGQRDLPARQRTMRATIDWSHSLLDQQSGILFRHLAIFTGGATLEAIESVGVSGDQRMSLLDALGRLVDCHLVRVNQDGASPRFMMLETIHEYAQEKLTASGEHHRVAERHAKYFLALATRWEASLANGDDRAEALATLEAEHDNLRAALGWTLDHAPSKAMAFAAPLGYFWHYGNHLLEGQEWLDRILALPRDPEDCVSGRAHAAVHASYFAWSLGDTDRARARATDALAEARLADHPFLIAESLRVLGGAMTDVGDFLAARGSYLEALGIYQSLSDDRRSTILLNNLGVNEYLGGGDLQASAAYLEDALAASRELGDPYLTGHVLLNVAELARDHIVNHARAAELYEEALDLLLRVDHRSVLAHGFAAASILAARREHYVAAARFLGASDALRTITGASIPLSEQRILENALQRTREYMGPDEFDVERAHGETLDMGDMVAEAVAVMQSIRTAASGQHHVMG